MHAVWNREMTSDMQMRLFKSYLIKQATKIQLKQRGECVRVFQCKDDDNKDNGEEQYDSEQDAECGEETDDKEDEVSDKNDSGEESQAKSSAIQTAHVHRVKS